MRQTKELVGSSFDMGLGPLKTITVDGGYGDYKHDEIDPDGTVLDSFIDKEWDSRAEALFGPLGPFSSSAIGVQLQRRDFSAEGDALNFLFPTVTTSEAGFAFTELPITNSFKFQVGARVEQDDLKGTPAGASSQVKRSFTPFSGSASLVFNPAEMVTLGLTVSSAARAPNVVELFAHGPHDGPGTFETGNPDLKAERANSLEGTVRVNMADTQFEGSLWGVSFDSYIHGQLTGNLCDDTGDCTVPDGEFRELNYTQGGARFWGIEGKAARALLTTDAGVVVGDIHADYVRATLKEGGDVPLVPPYRVGGGLGWQSNMVDADIHVTYTGPQNRTGEALSPTEGFVDLHVGATWRPMGYLPGLTLSAFGENLTDSKQRNAVALNRDVVLLPGRTFRFVARYTF
jgi:iron complex outermembrane receptor protein